MSRTDSIASHTLEEVNLTDESCLVDCCTQHSEVVMETHALNLTSHAIELEATVSRTLDCAETNLLYLSVNKLIPHTIIQTIERHR